jgi:hypothetical protein
MGKEKIPPAWSLARLMIGLKASMAAALCAGDKAAHEAIFNAVSC